MLGLCALALMLWAPQAGWFLRGFILGDNGNLNEIVVQNQSLRAELDTLSYLKGATGHLPRAYIPAMVYARYPGNAKNEILIAAGESQGVQVGQAVVILPFGATSTENNNPLLIGKVTEVSTDMAVVKTIFDAEWKSAVRIGSTGKEALLLGGNNPQLTLIEKKTSNIKESDIITNTSPDFPYGLIIGEIANVGLSADRLYEEASVRFSYGIGELQLVYVDTEFHRIGVTK